MICQILVYGLFIFEIKDRNLLLDFFIFLEFKLGLKKKKIRIMDTVRVCKFVLGMHIFLSSVRCFEMHCTYIYVAKVTVLGLVAYP